jgi:hypothetical protein
MKKFLFVLLVWTMSNLMYTNLNAGEQTSLNGDTYADLTIGAPGENSNYGVINVIYGDNSYDLNTNNDQMWGNENFLNGSYGSSITTGDFNGDGYQDIAVGMPLKTVDSVRGAGAINIIYGSAAGLSDKDSQIWTRKSADGLEGGLGEDDYFGSSLSAGDFNGDGFDDLIVGVPGHQNRSGSVNVLYGSALGLQVINNQEWNQDTGTIEGIAEDNDNFGSTLASGDFNGDGYDDVAIGAPYEGGEGNMQGVTLGVVHIIYGTKTGLDDKNNIMFSNRYTNPSSINTLFGLALASGDIDHDGFDDLAVSAPIGDNGYGAVSILYGSQGGINNLNSFEIIGSQVCSFNDPGFGKSLAFGDFNADNVEDLAVGAPRESVNGKNEAGVVVVYTSKSFSWGSQIIHQENTLPYIGGMIEAEDHFGTAVAAGDLNGDGFSDLIIGAPDEDVGSQKNAGAVHVVFGSADGLMTPHGYTVTQADVIGLSEAGDRFGSALTLKRVKKQSRRSSSMPAIYYLLGI